MTDPADPFRRHPELRALITSPEESFFRDFSLAKLEAVMAEHGLPGGWWRSDAERERLRAEALEGRRDADLWVFAYGSLMWDPGFPFVELRRARLPAHVRRFILKDIYGGRGDRKQPGLMAALDRCDIPGAACEGLVFRVDRSRIDHATRILFQREMVAPAYRPVFHRAETAFGSVETLAFIADDESELIDRSITRAEQTAFLAHGRGFLGTSLDYLRNIAAKFAALGIEDAEVEGLLVDAEAHAASGAPQA